MEHLLQADARVVAALAKSDPNHQGRANWIGRLILAVGFIPRGRGRATKAVLPTGVDPSQLAADLEALRQRLRELEQRLGELEAAGVRAPHPIFGSLDLCQWLRFVACAVCTFCRVGAPVVRRAMPP